MCNKHLGVSVDLKLLPLIMSQKSSPVQWLSGGKENISNLSPKTKAGSGYCGGFVPFQMCVLGIFFQEKSSAREFILLVK